MSNITGNAMNAISEKFGIIEFTTFGSLLGLSALIGIYYGCYKGNQNTVNEYMLGGKAMSVFPIAMSLIASHVSGITLLGLPSEVYEFGTQYQVGVLGTLFVVFITNKFYLPVFYDLQLYSLYEYLEMRFSREVRLLASFMFFVSLMVYIPIVIYIPALAFNQVTNISVHVITPIICILCIFYTTIGGLKAVVWTDAIQSLFTLGSVIVIIILGINKVGGIGEIFKVSQEGQRLELFNMDPNPFSRTTFFSVMCGATTLWTVILTIHPGSTQRFAALPSRKAAERSVMWFGAGITVITSLSSFVGLIMYTQYYNCDPIKAENLKTSGKLLPYYVQEVAKSFPGLLGVFISGLISAALSTMSAGLNTLAGTFYEDFITLCLPKKVSDATASFIMKVTVVVFGAICVLLVYVVEKLGSIIQMTFVLSAAPNGATFAAFALGIFFPWANWKGVMIGMISSTLIVTWMSVGAQLALLNQDLIFTGKPLDISGCNHTSNMTIFDSPWTNPKYEEIGQGVYATKDLFFLYKFAFLYYTPIGSVLGIVIGLVASFLIRDNSIQKLNPDLITPVMRRFLPVSANKKYESIAQELKLTVQEMKQEKS